MTRMKMYKSGKFWVSSAVTALGATGALLGGTSTQAHADAATDSQVTQASDQQKTVKAPSAADVQAQISAAMNTNPTNVQMDTDTTAPVSEAEKTAIADEKQTVAEVATPTNQQSEVTQNETTAAPDQVVETPEVNGSDAQDKTPQVPVDQEHHDDVTITTPKTDQVTPEVAPKAEVTAPKTDVTPDQKDGTNKSTSDAPTQDSKDTSNKTTNDQSDQNKKTVPTEKSVSDKQMAPKVVAPKVGNKAVATPKQAVKPTTVLTAKAKPVKAAQNYNYSATQKANAEFLYRYFSARGWTRSAIAGMLGNMTVESYLLPDITEIGGGGGYGLVQWTPASKLINWCNANGLNYRTLTGQAARIQYEMTNGIQFYPSYTSSMTAAQYMKSNASAYTLAIVFLANYERPYDSNQPERGNIAMYWYNYLGTINLSGNNNQPTPKPTPNPQAKNGYVWEGSNLYYYNNGTKVSGLRSYGQNGLEYYNPTTKAQVRNQQVRIGTAVYYFNGEGDAITGFRKFGKNSVEYYAQNHKRVANTYVQTGQTYYYMDGNGQAISGLRRYSKSGLEYYNPTTRLQTRNNYAKVGNNFYYFNGEGDAVNGFRKYGKNGLEYYNPTTQIQTRNNYVQSGKNVYYFNGEGDAVSGFRKYGKNGLEYYNPTTHIQQRNNYVQSGKNFYYFNGEGDAVSGFRKYGKNGLEYYNPTTHIQQRNNYVQSGKNLYYFNANGDAVTGLRKYGKNKLEYYDPKTHIQARNKAITIGKQSYYFGGNGDAVSGTVNRNGKIEFYNPSNYTRRTTPGYVKQGNTYVFLDNKGYGVTGLRRYGKNGLEYYSPKTGLQVRNGYVNVKGVVYYFNREGDAINGVRNLGKGYIEYYVNHARVQNKTLKVNGVMYRFDANGRGKRI